MRLPFPRLGNILAGIVLVGLKWWFGVWGNGRATINPENATTF